MNSKEKSFKRLFLLKLQSKLKKKTRERTLSMSASMNQDNPNQIKIGHYILGETLGNGSFGKVKSEPI